MMQDRVSNSYAYYYCMVSPNELIIRTMAALSGISKGMQFSRFMIFITDS